MLKSTQIELRQSEIRERCKALLAIETRSEAETKEMGDLTAESQKLEPELRAAKVVEGTDEVTLTKEDAETRERLELRGKARLGRFMSSRLSGRVLDGAEAEYRAAIGGGDGIPFDLFEQDRPRELELRADAATVVPASATKTNVAALQPFIFSESIAAGLGIDMPTVGSGAHTEARISAALTAGPKNKGTAQSSTAATIVGVTAKPRRIASRLSVQHEDVALFGNDSFEASLRENARAVLGDAYDTQCINGDGSAPNVDGLINQLTDPDNPTAVATWVSLLATAASGIDGLWAKTLRAVRLTVNPATYQLASALLRGAEGPISAAAYLAQHAGGFETNKRMPPAASNIAHGIVYRIGRPEIRTAVHPTWGEVAIDDIYTDSDSGTRHFTLSVLVGDKVLIVQPDAYKLVKFKLA